MAAELSDLQKKTAQAIVNVFESGRPLGDYGAVSARPDDPGGLSYGRSQAALMPGSLYQLVSAYCQSAGAACAEALSPYLPRLQQRDASLTGDAALKALLLEAAGDPAMQRTQDGFFDRVYWTPSLSAASGMGTSTALGVAITYDSFVQSGAGGWLERKDETDLHVGRMAEAGEDVWYATYVDLRRHWLADSPNPLVRKTVYRMDAMGSLIAAGKWTLELPLTVLGVVIGADALAGKTAPRE